MTLKVHLPWGSLPQARPVLPLEALDIPCCQHTTMNLALEDVSSWEIEGETRKPTYPLTPSLAVFRTLMAVSSDQPGNIA